MEHPENLQQQKAEPCCLLACSNTFDRSFELTKSMSSVK